MRSFNCTTVDSDTSTSDTVLLIATGQAKHPRIPSADGNAARNRMLADFARALNDVLLDLALQVMRDGEGAQKLVKIDVTGAANADARRRRIAMTVANSPLVKTAIAGRGRELGPHRDGGRQSGRAGGPRQAVDRRRRRLDGARGRRDPRLRRDAGRRAHEGPRDRDRDRSSAWDAARPPSGPAT